MTRRVVLASGNRGKVAELSTLLEPAGLVVEPQSDHGVPEAEEPHPTFVENALAKARNAARHTGLAAIADDSGLEVDALDGAPGVLSARYAGPDSDDAANNARLLAELEGLPAERRTARFVCVLAYLDHADDPTPIIAQGFWEGRILEAPRGAGGFGYDPLFWVPDHGCASAELDATEKNRISHRGRALATLRSALAD
ncbi:XTP/dITP diphosphohydrolase [Thiohalospira halophila DSM 15071]|uniref:dITP/XTP pyrophosphatase n=1 Tax=Thiohalospira halophila DSM 15071 TaxID=1123397 RepID=A0A1I1PZN6_9GAMM|nr:RdgB/HAM1 family non-canonical purine NTP pyrophosphatase [Thiohalospira halophila]SFD15187.1 XTP/dITP diphosphohydrolase [Thiohalospira halophila DSM 15071]